jgi:hypothetical protein
LAPHGDRLAPLQDGVVLEQWVELKGLGLRLNASGCQDDGRKDSPPRVGIDIDSQPPEANAVHHLMVALSQNERQTAWTVQYFSKRLLRMIPAQA